MQKVKVVLLVPSLKVGGMERVMSLLANYLSTQSTYSVYLILYGINREVFYKLEHDVVLVKPEFPFDNSKRTLSTLKTLLFLRKEVRKIKPDVVLSFGELWNNFSLVALKFSGIPVLVSDRCNPSKNLGVFHEFLRRILYPGANQVIVQTQKAAALYQKKLGIKNLCVIGNPIKLQASDFSSKEKIVLSVGRLISSKQFDVLIRVFSEVNPPDWKLVIVGEDDQQQRNKEKYLQLIQEIGLQEKIILSPFTHSIESWYEKAAIFAFTSRSEGFPNVLGEAMSFGLPVIAFDCLAGPSDLIVDGQTGFLIPENNNQEFGEKLHKMMESESLRLAMGQAGKEHVAKFESTKICKQFEERLVHAIVAN